MNRNLEPGARVRNRAQHLDVVHGVLTAKLTPQSKSLKFSIITLMSLSPFIRIEASCGVPLGTKRKMCLPSTFPLNQNLRFKNLSCSPSPGSKCLAEWIAQRIQPQQIYPSLPWTQVGVFLYLICHFVFKPGPCVLSLFIKYINCTCHLCILWAQNQVRHVVGTCKVLSRLGIDAHMHVWMVKWTITFRR